MRNRFYYVLIGILFCFSFINSVYANTVVSVDADGTSVPEGTIVSIKVNVKSDVALSSCLFQISSEGDIAFQSSDGINLWEKDEDESSVGTFVKNSNSSSDLSKGINVLELKYVINGSSKVNVETLNCVNATSGEKITGIGSTKVDFKATEAVKNTTLSSVLIDGSLIPSFSSQKYSYNVELNSPKFSLSYVTGDSNFSDKVVVKNEDKTITNLENITFSGNDQGMMLIKLIVAEETTYTLNVKYKQTGLDNTLKSVTINGKELKLEKGKYDYEYTVGKDVTSFTVVAVLNDSENFKFNSSVGNVPDPGTATFNIRDYSFVQIIVEPKSSSMGIAHLEYNITVKREGTTDKPVTGGSKPNVDNNPGTGGISAYIMLFVLVVSLIGSIILYQKNLESYK